MEYSTFNKNAKVYKLKQYQPEYFERIRSEGCASLRFGSAGCLKADFW